MRMFRFARRSVKRSILLILLCLHALGPGAAPAVSAPLGFHLSGRYLVDSNGVNFIMRGINHMHTWFPQHTSAFQQIKAKGANTVRVVLSSGQYLDWEKNSAADVRDVIGRCKTNRLICVLEVHDTTGYKDYDQRFDPSQPVSLAEAVRYWKDVKSALDGQEAYVILNIGNEPYGNPDPNHLEHTLAWVTDTKNAIVALRSAGFQHMLMVDAPNWGQDWQLKMQEHAAEILSADPQHNTVFSIHMYEVFGSATPIREYLSHFVNAGLPIVIGEFAHIHGDNNVDEDSILSISREYGIGYLGWAWSGNCCDAKAAELDMVVNFNPNQETPWGTRIIRGPNGIVETSVEASVYSGERNPIVSSIRRGKPNPTSGGSVRFTVTFSEAVTGVNTSAPFDDFLLATTGVTGASITSVSGSGATYLVTVNTGSGSGTIRLNLLDNDSIKDAKNNSLGGPLPGNGNYSAGELVTIIKPTNVDVSAGGVLEAQYFVPQSGSMRQSLAGVSQGPVKIQNTAATPMIAAERVIYKVNGVNTSFSELLALPDSQLDTTYWLPWYNNIDLDTQLRIANVSGAQATITVTIGSAAQPSFNLAAGASTRVSYPVSNGPVKIQSTQNIVAAERVIYRVNGIATSFSEMMALPQRGLSQVYYLPWYDNVNLDSQLRIANVSSSPATVTVTIGTVARPSFNLPVGASTRVSYPVNNGPVRIQSNQNIVVAERVIYKANNANTSFSEMMALPASQLNTLYWLPWYNNVDLDTQLRIANIGSSTARVTVTIGGVSQPSFNLAIGTSVPVSYAANNGPVKIQSNQNIVVAERVIYKVNGIPTSFSEMMGLPNSLLRPVYWLPWYNNVDLDTQLRFGIP